MPQRGWEDTWAQTWGMGMLQKIERSCKKRGGFEKMGRVGKKWGGFKKQEAVAHREDVEEVVQQAESESAHIAGKASSVYLEI